MPLAGSHAAKKGLHRRQIAGRARGWGLDPEAGGRQASFRHSHWLRGREGVAVPAGCSRPAGWQGVGKELPVAVPPPLPDRADAGVPAQHCAVGKTRLPRGWRARVDGPRRCYSGIQGLRRAPPATPADRPAAGAGARSGLCAQLASESPAGFAVARLAARTARHARSSRARALPSELLSSPHHRQALRRLSPRGAGRSSTFSSRPYQACKALRLRRLLQAEQADCGYALPRSVGRRAAKPLGAGCSARTSSGA